MSDGRVELRELPARHIRVTLLGMSAAAAKTFRTVVGRTVGGTLLVALVLGFSGSDVLMALANVLFVLALVAGIVLGIAAAVWSYAERN